MANCFGKWIGLSALLLICVCVVVATTGQFSVHVPDSITDNVIEPFPIMSFVPPAITEKQLKLFKDANFTVLTIWPKQHDYEVMKKHWNGNYILYNCWESGASYDDMLEFHPGDPQLVGYFLGDEPNYIRISELGKVADRFRAANPDKYCFVNLFPQYAGPQIGSHFFDYVIKYFETLRPRYCMLDNYPCFWFNVDRSDFYHDLEILRYYADKYDSRQIGFVQVYSSNVCREMSESDIAWQVNTFLAYGCKGLWYFNYRHPAAKGGPVLKNELLSEIYDFRKSPGTMVKPYKSVRTFGSAVLDMDDRPDYAYPYVKSLNAKVIAWGKVLSGLKSVAVFHACGSLAPGYNPYDPVGSEPFHPGKLPYIINILPDKTESPMGYIVSYFKDKSQRPYIMIVNKKHGEDISCEQAAVPTRIEFKDDVHSVYRVSNVDGGEKKLDIKEKTFVEKIGGGEAILMRLGISDDE